jgi:hypothetical protein
LHHIALLTLNNRNHSSYDLHHSKTLLHSHYAQNTSQIQKCFHRSLYYYHCQSQNYRNFQLEDFFGGDFYGYGANIFDFLGNVFDAYTDWSNSNNYDENFDYNVPPPMGTGDLESSWGGSQVNPNYFGPPPANNDNGNFGNFGFGNGNNISFGGNTFGSGRCSAHSDCGVGSYCDAGRNCYDCGYLASGVQCDAIDGDCCSATRFLIQCPSNPQQQQCGTSPFNPVDSRSFFQG